MKKSKGTYKVINEDWNFVRKILFITLLFTLTACAPKIISIDPQTGSVGAEVTIKGKWFKSAADKNRVKFAGEESTDVTIPQKNTIVAKVPPRAQTGPVTVTTNLGTGKSKEDFVLSSEHARPVVKYGEEYHLKNSYGGGSYLDTCDNNSCRTSTRYGVVTDSKPDRAGVGTGKWIVESAVNKSNRSDVRIGDEVYIKNLYNDGSYLDTCNNSSCSGASTRYGVVTDDNPGRDGVGTGIWIIQSAANKANGSNVRIGDEVYIKNLYSGGSYLDTCNNSSCSGASTRYGVVTDDNPDRDGVGTGKWSFHEVTSFLPGTPQKSVRVSVKIILNDDLTYPQYGAYPFDRDVALVDFNYAFDHANRTLMKNGLPLRLDFLEMVELEELGAWNSSSVASRESCPKEYEDRNIDDCGNRLFCLNELAPKNSELYGYRDDAVNVYVLSCTGDANGGAFPSSVILIRPYEVEPPGRPNLLHELGHHFKLSHTHKGEQKIDCSSLNGIERRNLLPGEEDNVDDTLPDHTCWYIDDLAIVAYGQSYMSLGEEETKMVNGTYENLMSYHGNSDIRDANDKFGLTLEPQSNLTEGQLLRASNHAGVHPDEIVLQSWREVDISRDLISELLGRPSGSTGEAAVTWVSTGGEIDWVTDLTLTSGDVSSGICVPVCVEVGSDITSGGYEEIAPHVSLYGDRLMFFPDPISLPAEEHARNLTYTVRMRADGKLEVRVSVYQDRRFLEHNVILTRSD